MADTAVLSISPDSQYRVFSGSDPVLAERIAGTVGWREDHVFNPYNRPVSRPVPYAHVLGVAFPDGIPLVSSGSLPAGLLACNFALETSPGNSITRCDLHSLGYFLSGEDQPVAAVTPGSREFVYFSRGHKRFEAQMLQPTLGSIVEAAAILLKRASANYWLHSSPHIGTCLHSYAVAATELDYIGHRLGLDEVAWVWQDKEELPPEFMQFFRDAGVEPPKKPEEKKSDATKEVSPTIAEHAVTQVA